MALAYQDINMKTYNNLYPEIYSIKNLVLAWKRARKGKTLEKHGLNKEMISLLLKQRKVEEFRELLHILKKPQVVAKTLLIFPKEIASKEKKSLAEIEKILNMDILGNVLEKVHKGTIKASEIKNVLREIVKGKKHEEVKKEDLHVIEEKISRIIKEKPGLSVNAYMGLVMKEFHGKILGKEASEIIKKYVK